MSSFFVGTQTGVSLLQTTQIISDVCFITDHFAYASSKKPQIVWIETEHFFFFFFLTWGGCTSCLHACLGARLLSQSYQYPNLSEGAAHIGEQLRGDRECPFSGATKSGRVWRKMPESDARSVRPWMSDSSTDIKQSQSRLFKICTEWCLCMCQMFCHFWWWCFLLFLARCAVQRAVCETPHLPKFAWVCDMLPILNHPNPPGKKLLLQFKFPPQNNNMLYNWLALQMDQLNDTNLLPN